MGYFDPDPGKTDHRGAEAQAQDDKPGSPAVQLLNIDHLRADSIAPDTRTAENANEGRKAIYGRTLS